MTNLLYSAKHYQTKCAEALDSVINYANIASELLNDAKNIAKSATFGNIGDIKYTIRKEVPNGGFWCDGSLIHQNDLPTIYDMLLQQKLHSVDINTYNNVVNLNGSCGFFGLDTVNKSFKLPLLQDIYIKAGQEADEFGAESLPNITGDSPQQAKSENIAGNAFYGGKSGQVLYGTSWEQSDRVSFDASRSSPTYQDGAKVNPDHVKYRAYIILYFAEKEMSIVNWTNQLEKKTNEGIAQIDAKADSYLDKTQITNCIIEIPQDIKLELNNGVVSAKAGSKIRYPDGKNEDGSLRFGEIVLESDVVNGGGGGTPWQAQQYYVHFNSGDNYIQFTAVNNAMHSGDIQPALMNGSWWYDTANNYLKKCDGSSWNITTYSLPIALATCSDGSTISSIDQVFNGFGYIGSTIFALPGVKGLIPNGRNADGSLKNIEFEIDKVTTITRTDTRTTTYITLDTEGVLSISALLDSGTTYYDEQNNLFIKNAKDFGGSTMAAGTFTCTNGVITSLNHKLSFKAIDYNDKQNIINWNSPDWTAEIAVNATSYTAPKAGIVLINCQHADHATNQVTINGVQLYSMYMTGSYANGTLPPFETQVSAGDVIISNQKILKFYPYKGA